MQKKFTVELVYSEKANVYYYFLLWHQFLVFKTLTYRRTFLSVGPDHQCLDVVQSFHWLWHHIHDQLQLLKTANNDKQF